MSNNNSTVILVSGTVLSLLLIIFLLFNKQMVQPQLVIPQQVAQAPAPPVVVQPEIINNPVIVGQPYPHSYPQYHSNRAFWDGYSDGWNGFRYRSEGVAYLQGYEIGRHDRTCNHAYYHERYCPPGFSLRLPGLRINVR